jgi:hypothetical protein
MKNEAKWHLHKSSQLTKNSYYENHANGLYCHNCIGQ